MSPNDFSNKKSRIDVEHGMNSEEKANDVVYAGSKLSNATSIVKPRNELPNNTVISKNISYQTRNSFRSYSKPSNFIRSPSMRKPYRKVVNHVSGSRNDGLMTWIASVKSLAQGALNRNNEMEKQLEEEIRVERQRREDEEAGPRLEAFNQLGNILGMNDRVSTTVFMPTTAEIHNQSSGGPLNSTYDVKSGNQSSVTDINLESYGSQSSGDESGNIFIEEEEAEPLIHQSEESDNESFLEENSESEYEPEDKMNGIFQSASPAAYVNYERSDSDSDIIIMSDSDEDAKTASYINKPDNDLPMHQYSHEPNETHGEEKISYKNFEGIEGEYEEEYNEEYEGESEVYEEGESEEEEEEEGEEEEEDEEEEEENIRPNIRPNIYGVNQEFPFNSRKEIQHKPYAYVDNERSFTAEDTNDFAETSMSINYMRPLHTENAHEYEENNGDDAEEQSIHSSEVECYEEEEYSQELEMNLGPQLVPGNMWQDSQAAASYNDVPRHDSPVTHNADAYQGTIYSESSSEESSESEEGSIEISEDEKHEYYEDFEEDEVDERRQEDHQLEEVEKSQNDNAIGISSILLAENRSASSANVNTLQSHIPDDTLFDPQILAEAFISTYVPSTPEVSQVLEDASVTNVPAAKDSTEVQDYSGGFPVTLSATSGSGSHYNQASLGSYIPRSESEFLNSGVYLPNSTSSQELVCENVFSIPEIPSEEGNIMVDSFSENDSVLPAVSSEGNIRDNSANETIIGPDRVATPSSGFVRDKPVISNLGSRIISSGFSNLNFPAIEVPIPTFKSLSFSFGQHIGEKRENVEGQGSHSFDHTNIIYSKLGKTGESNFASSHQSGAYSLNPTNSGTELRELSKGNSHGSLNSILEVINPVGISSPASSEAYRENTDSFSVNYVSNKGSELSSVEEIRESTHNTDRMSLNAVMTIDSEVTEPHADSENSNEELQDIGVLEYDMDIESENENENENEDENENNQIGDRMTTNIISAEEIIECETFPVAYFPGAQQQSDSGSQSHNENETLQPEAAISVLIAGSLEMVDNINELIVDRTQIPIHPISIEAAANEEVGIRKINSDSNVSGLSSIMENVENIPETVTPISENVTIDLSERNKPLYNMDENTKIDTALSSEEKAATVNYSDSSAVLNDTQASSLEVPRPATPVSRRTRSFSEVPSTPRKAGAESKVPVTPRTERILRTECQKQCLVEPSTDNDVRSEIYDKSGVAVGPMEMKQENTEYGKGKATLQGIKNRKKRANSTPFSSKRSKRSNRKVNLNK